MELDATDRKIVAALMQDATLPVTRLAQRVGLTSTPCWKRVQKLNEAGIIRGRVAVVDFAKLGYGLSVFVGVEAPDHGADWHLRFKDMLQAVPQVLAAHRLAGAVDYLLHVVVRDMAEFDAVCLHLNDALPVRDMASHFVVETVKSTGGPPFA